MYHVIAFFHSKLYNKKKKILVNKQIFKKRKIKPRIHLLVHSNLGHKMYQ